LLRLMIWRKLYGIYQFQNLQDLDPETGSI
jgi:hypothetical protein